MYPRRIVVCKLRVKQNKFFQYPFGNDATTLKTKYLFD